MRSKLFGLASLCFAAVGCSDPFSFDANAKPKPDEEEEACPVSPEWLPRTPAVDQYRPPPHPASECAFYRASWQNFMIVTQPEDDGTIALQSFATVDDLFERKVPRAERHAWLGDIKQAGGRQILIDQAGRPIYYGIHVNKVFEDFVQENGLRTAEGVRNAPSELFLPADVVELKSAWQVVDGDEEDPTFITTRALVSRMSQKDGHILEDHNDPIQVTVRLLALHVAFTLPGHPELIWSTFEHARPSDDADFKEDPSDIAPIRRGKNPSLTDPNNLNDSTVVRKEDTILFKGGTRANEGNQGIAESELTLDVDNQLFVDAQTSIYRMFPASKSNTTEADGAIDVLNANVQELFDKAEDILPSDRRRFYRLAGAVWMDKPEYFKTNATLVNDADSPFAKEPDFEKDIQENGSDSEFSLLAGEDRLSSVAMESFTQAPAAFPNCFSCHNTQAVTEKGVPIDRDRQGTMLMGPKQLNVSHVFSQFLMDEANAARSMD
ncbi:MAG TPA: hypothetical protein VFN67_34725 [Polyangiales bacterium]|nr:hypothetical protein [Polyangiales bacterium]